MFNKLLALSLLSLSTALSSAEIYQCIDKGVTSYSTQPCANQFIDLELDDTIVDPVYSSQERFITPVYPSWKSGWKKTKQIQLERFSEVIYEPVGALGSEKSSEINLQQLTNLPDSMSAQRFAISVADIIDSICVNTVIDRLPIETGIETLFYGQYVCSLRRDTQQGEMGVYKIIRGKNSIYMIAIKWEIEPVEVKGYTLNPMQQAKISEAKQYLKNAVKLCQTADCFSS